VRGQYESLMNKGQALQEKQHNGRRSNPRKSPSSSRNATRS
jgi:hypothetical protein